MNDDGIRDEGEIGAIDLSPIDPMREMARFDAITAELAREAARAIDLNRSRDDVFDGIVRWWPAPLVAAALVLAIIPLSRPAEAPDTTSASAAEVLGIPRALSDVLHSNQTPSLSELRAALVIPQGQ